MNGMLNGKLVFLELLVCYFLCGGYILKYLVEFEIEN